ncbi:MAG: hypothetical protein FWE60_00245 [Oscillospiraceae bacterium]|nr:hypothetical protein [Oscillospiraceae bacterium]
MLNFCLRAGFCRCSGEGIGGASPHYGGLPLSAASGGLVLLLVQKYQNTVAQTPRPARCNLSQYRND